MALFFNRISKLYASRNNARFFSSLPQSPCLLFESKALRQSPEGKIVNHILFDPTTEEKVYSKEKKLPKELDGQSLVGASQGWVASVGNKDLTVHITDLYKPCVSSARVISLPPLKFKPSTHATEVSLSTCDPIQGDFTVAAKFNECRLSFCRPYWDAKWTHIETADSPLPASDLMYSKRDKAFYFTSLKGLYMGALDLSNKKLKYQQLRLRNMPKIPEVGWEILDQCFMSKHLVESPSGELFFIKWYTQCIRTPCNNKEDKDGEYEMIHSVTKRFMVFREDGKNIDFCYTEDIGDLCIFLGKSEAFCLKASMYPGLKPNSIYYIGPGLGSYDLASNMVRPYNPPASGAPSLVRAPFWLHPTYPIA
ncbi:hypothetical protein AALP_AA8G363600 [Arabis alpina]|uniref:KIB1-4 beta-propeller domain-containing protein n=1 Tax=Arabis alpina TaxID=50452 RepID=A0A087GBP0_ARAAL|nr:hypothetical protein AALP_AA8G363600 [Arabis alpina]